MARMVRKRRMNESELVRQLTLNEGEEQHEIERAIENEEIDIR